MEDLVSLELAGLFMLETFQFRYWNVADENVGTRRCLPAGGLVNVGDGEVNRPCGLVTGEGRQMCLVGGDDD